MVSTIELSGARCRGRNGWFSGRTLMVYTAGQDRIVISIKSQRASKQAAPICVELRDDEAQMLADTLLAMIGGRVP